MPLLEHLPYVAPDVLPIHSLDSAGWLTIQTPYRATMSASECKRYERIKADRKLTMPGRLGVKETLHSISVHMLGLCGVSKSNLFCLTSPTGIVCVMLVDSIRMDLSHQTVFLDAALLSPRSDDTCTYPAPMVASLSAKLVRIVVTEDEAMFWKHLLPAFAERCGSWTHKTTCEYQAEGRFPISTATNTPFVCSCGYGAFPEKYLASTKPFKAVTNSAVRVAIPVIFASPISKEDMSLAEPEAYSSSARPHRFTLPTAHTDQPKKARCLKCGAATTKAGNSLLKCAKCKTAQYCSPDCQKKDWKKHKQMCKQTQEKGVGDDVA